MWHWALPLRFDPYLAAGLLALLVQLGFFLRWMHRRMRDDEIHVTFVRDIALNHLPHIYRVLRQIAAHNGIEMEDPPPLRFVDMNGEWRQKRT